MKQKNSSSAKKRFKLTGSGNLRQRKSSRNHLLTNKSKRQKKLHPTNMEISQTNVKRVKRLLRNI
jgi:large subunit ribosomal protein L35